LSTDPTRKGFTRAGGVKQFPIGLLGLLIQHERREEAEIDIHRLISVRVRAAGDVIEQGADCGVFGRESRRLTVQLCGPKASSKHTDGGAFDIALAPSDLTTEADVEL
jgi:hypothetical protein